MFSKTMHLIIFIWVYVIYKKKLIRLDIQNNGNASTIFMWLKLHYHVYITNDLFPKV